MKKFTSLMVVALFFCGLSAHAQFTATVEQYANTTYECTSAQFKLSEVAAAVGSDAATLGAALDAWYATDADENYVNEDTQLFGVLNADGTVNYGYNAAGRGSFWMTTDGTVDGWAAGNVYNDILYYSVDNDYFVIDVGEHDATGATTATLKFALTFNGQQATFTVNYTAKEIPAVDPAPSMATDLTIVGTATGSSEQEPHGDYASTAVSIPVSGILEGLGLDSETLNAVLSTRVYAKQYDSEYGLLTDTLLCLGDNGGWTKETVYADGEKAGEASGIVAWNGWGDGDAYYMDTWAYDEETGNLTFNVGQYPGSLKAGQALTCNLYICNGAKAYQVDYTLNVIEPQYDSVDDLTKVGSTDITVELNPSDEYAYTTTKVDVDAIAAALGCETSGMALRALAEPGKLATSSTANNGGWWLTLEGYVTAWSTSSGGSVWYIEPVSTTDFSTLTVGEMPDMLEVGDQLTTTLYAISGSNRYDINVTLNIVQGQDNPQDFVSVATRNITIQALSAGYEWSEGKTIPNTDINNLLGITGDDAVLYALNIDSIAQQKGQAYTKSYSMSPTPGFWVTEDGKRIAWSNATDSPWGMTTGNITDQDGVTFQCMQFDGGSEAGTTYKGQFFLVNEETNEMITVNLTYQVVESLDDVTEVGNTSITVPVSGSDAEIDFPVLSEIATALEVDDLLSGYYLRGMNANSLWCDAVAATTGLTFTTEGYAAEMENIGIYFEDGKICTYSNTEIESGWKAEAQLCFEANAKRYIVNVTMMNADDYAAGINTVNTTVNAGKIYTIGGVETTKMVKGVYIQNGRKVVVK